MSRPDPDIHLEPLDQLRIRQAMGHMPYASGLGADLPYTAGYLTADRLVEWLEALAERLREHSAECDRDRDELSALRNDLAALAQTTTEATR